MNNIKNKLTPGACGGWDGWRVFVAAVSPPPHNAGLFLPLPETLTKRFSFYFFDLLSMPECAFGTLRKHVPLTLL